MHVLFSNQWAGSMLEAFVTGPRWGGALWRRAAINGGSPCQGARGAVGERGGVKGLRMPALKL